MVVLTMKVPWQTALGAVFISGIVFVATASFGLRETIIAAVPESLKSAIAVGIVLLITLIGMEWAGLVRLDPNTFVALGSFDHKPVLVALLGLLTTIILIARKVRGAILYGILIAALAGMAVGVVSRPSAVMSLPPAPTPTAFQLDVVAALKQNLIGVIFVFFFLDLFDTVGSLLGIAKQADLMKEGKLPRAGRALLADAIGTVGSALMGNTTMVSYVESASGVAVGGRTGLNGAGSRSAVSNRSVLLSCRTSDQWRIPCSRGHLNTGPAGSADVYAIPGNLTRFDSSRQFDDEVSA
jgi:AGZA family xanthine/uracil permease-like MFS transporter